MVLISGLGRSPGGGYGNPLQYSCLENPMDRGTWWSIIHRVTQSQTQLKQLRVHALPTIPIQELGVWPLIWGLHFRGTLPLPDMHKVHRLKHENTEGLISAPPPTVCTLLVGAILNPKSEQEQFCRKVIRAGMCKLRQFLRVPYYRTEKKLRQEGSGPQPGGQDLEASSQASL